MSSQKFSELCIGNWRIVPSGDGAKLLFDPAQTKADGEATIKSAKESIDKMVNDRAGMQLSINAIDNTASKKLTDEKAAADKTATNVVILFLRIIFLQFFIQRFNFLNFFGIKLGDHFGNFTTHKEGNDNDKKV